MKHSIWWATPASAAHWFSVEERRNAQLYHRPLRRAAAGRLAARLMLVGALLPVTRSAPGASMQPTTVDQALSAIWIPAATALAWWLPGVVTEGWFQFVHEPRFGRGRPRGPRFLAITVLLLTASVILPCAVALVLWSTIDPADPASWWTVASIVLVLAVIVAVLDGSGVGPLARDGVVLAEQEAAPITQLIGRLGGGPVAIRLLDDRVTPGADVLNACSAGAFGPPRLSVTAGLLAESPLLLEFVVTHEVGHLRLGHHRRSFVTAVIGALVVVGALGAIVASAHRLGLDLLVAGAWPLLWLIAVALGGLTGVAQAFLGRADERAADRFAIERLPQLPSVELIRRLHVSATANLEPRLVERMIAHHPTPAERLAWLGHHA